MTEPCAYMVVNDQGYIVGAWRDKAIAEDVCRKGQPSHHQEVVPVYSAPLDETQSPAEQALEISRLNAAVNSFADAMKAKLVQKATEGFHGWDKPVFKCAIVTDLIRKANLVEFAPAQAVDIANFAMMLWHQSLAKEGG